MFKILLMDICIILEWNYWYSKRSRSISFQFDQWRVSRPVYVESNRRESSDRLSYSNVSRVRFGCGCFRTACNWRQNRVSLVLSRYFSVD
jgi:hypothetical protein